MGGLTNWDRQVLAPKSPWIPACAICLSQGVKAGEYSDEPPRAKTLVDGTALCADHATQVARAKFGDVARPPKPSTGAPIQVACVGDGINIRRR